MRTKILLSLFALASLFTLGLTRAQEVQDPQEDEGTRDVFLSSRKPASSGTGTIGGNSNFSGSGTIAKATPKPTPKPAAAARPTPKPTPKPGPGSVTTAKNTPKPPVKGNGNTGSSGTTASVKPPTNNNGGASIVNVKLDPSSIGLGYSLFQRGAGDEPIRVDPTNEFRTGDAVRISLEPNVDGYLYIFNTTDNGKATMIYPSSHLNGGNNRVKGHFPFELPSAEEKNPNDRWFSFYGATGTEQIYIVLTKEPLRGLPQGLSSVTAYCAQHKDANGQCQVEDGLWAQIKGFDQKDQVKVAKNSAGVGQKQAKAERPTEVASRGFGLAPQESAPTIIFMNASADRSVLFAKLELVHK